MTALPAMTALLAMTAVLACGAATTAAADGANAAATDPCAGFKWDITKERALFATAPKELTAGRNPVKAAVLMPDRLFQLRLARRAQVKFAVKPGRKGAAAGPYAGIALIQTGMPGTYRISVDQPLWIDVDLRGQLLVPKDFEGAHGCQTPRKIVEFELTDPQPYVLQFSGAPEPRMRVTVTREPGH